MTQFCNGDKQYQDQSPEGGIFFLSGIGKKEAKKVYPAMIPLRGRMVAKRKTP